jgi:hypothetical protein
VITKDAGTVALIAGSRMPNSSARIKRAIGSHETLVTCTTKNAAWPLALLIRDESSNSKAAGCDRLAALPSSPTCRGRHRLGLSDQRVRPTFWAAKSDNGRLPRHAEYGCAFLATLATFSAAMD